MPVLLCSDASSEIIANCSECTACLVHAAGAIPSELCFNTRVSIDVSDSSIHCYSGCLTSSPVQIIGASDDCHDGSQMRRFICACGVFCAATLLCTCAHRWRLAPAIGTVFAAPAADLGDKASTA